MNECKHINWEYAIDYSEYSWISTLTGHSGGDCYINRYCSECKKSMGYLDSEESSQFRGVIFSPDLDEVFRKQDEKEKIRQEKLAQKIFEDNERKKKYGE